LKVHINTRNEKPKNMKMYLFTLGMDYCNTIVYGVLKKE
jgi:hypothetical protein